jgi:hypothetical protein
MGSFLVSLVFGTGTLQVAPGKSHRSHENMSGSQDRIEASAATALFKNDPRPRAGWVAGSNPAMTVDEMRV